jgi:hypothetical protein
VLPGQRGHVRGGDLVLATPDGTRLALHMEHGSLAVIEAKRDAHASTVAFTADDGCKRLVASLYCEPRLLEKAVDRRCKRRFATWPPSVADVRAYKRTDAYRNSAAGKAERAPAAVVACGAADGARSPGCAPAEGHAPQGDC